MDDELMLINGMVSHHVEFGRVKSEADRKLSGRPIAYQPPKPMSHQDACDFVCRYGDLVRNTDVQATGTPSLWRLLRAEEIAIRNGQPKEKASEAVTVIMNHQENPEAPLYSVE